MCTFFFFPVFRFIYQFTIHRTNGALRDEPAPLVIGVKVELYRLWKFICMREPGRRV